MGLPRTFVGFSSTDISHYWLMCAWKDSEHLDFDFCDCQLQSEIDSEDEDYIKRKCRARIHLAGTYMMLIGSDTRYKHKYVIWEAEVAREKNCRIIGVNLDGWRRINTQTCPQIMKDIGAMFVPYSPQIVAHALKYAKNNNSKNWEFRDPIYTQLGYAFDGNRAFRPKRPNPFA